MFLKSKNILVPLIGASAGFLSGLLGTGGGLVVVPSLIKLGFNQKNAHATSVAVMLPISFSLALMYLIRNSVSIQEALPYVPMGIVGALVGSVVLPKLNQNILRKAFGCFSLWAAYKLLVG